MPISPKLLSQIESSITDEDLGILARVSHSEIFPQLPNKNNLDFVLFSNGWFLEVPAVVNYVNGHLVSRRYRAVKKEYVSRLNQASYTRSEK